MKKVLRSTAPYGIRGVKWEDRNSKEKSKEENGNIQEEES